MSFIALTPSAPPSRRGGVSIRLARPTRGTFTHVEARFFVERPLALEVGMAPGDRCSVAVGEGADAGWLRIACDKAGAFTFGRSGGTKGGGCVVSVGHTERFGRTPGHHRIDRTLIRASDGALLIPLPPALRGGQQQEEQAPGSADLGPGEGKGSCAPATDPSPTDSGPQDGPASPEVEAPLAGGAVSVEEDGHVDPLPKNSTPRAATPETPERDWTQAVLDALADGPMAPGALASEVGCNAAHLRTVMKPLLEAGRVVAIGATGNRRYVLSAWSAAPAAAPAAQEAAPAPARQPSKPLPGFRIGQDNGAKGRAAATKAPPKTAPQPEDERIRKLFDPDKDQGAGYVAAALGWPLPRVTRRLKDLGLVRAG